MYAIYFMECLTNSVLSIFVMLQNQLINFEKTKFTIFLYQNGLYENIRYLN